MCGKEIDLKRVTIVIISVLAAIFIGVLSAALIINGVIVRGQTSNIAGLDGIEGEYDCILVLGAGVRGETPSHMLSDRLDFGVALYEMGASDRIVMSGDHSRVDYDEVNVMKDYAVGMGVPSSSIFMDHAGFSTYESIYRIKEIFGARKIIIVSQEYHLYRALYIAESFGLEAVGVPSDPRSYSNQAYRDVREVLARNKDFFMCIFKPLPKYLGEPISLLSSGDVTNDK